jgi:sodium-dependent phosphate cotransporter
LVKGGFLKGAGDVGSGIIGVILSLLLLSGGMLGLTKCLTKIFMSKAKKIIALAMMMNDYIGILVGLGITIIVQSSSVTTTALTPLAAIGVLPLNKMYPMTLGANIGTTTTALLASLVSLKKQGVQIALCHFFFNIFGIMLYFPAPFMRSIPIRGAKTLGTYTCLYKWAPLAYICLCFLVIPAVSFGVVETYNANIAGGVVLTLFVLGGVAALVVAWNIGIPVGNALCYRVMSKEDREKFDRELLEDNARIGGITPEEYKLKDTLKWSGM